MTYKHSKDSDHLEEHGGLVREVGGSIPTSAMSLSKDTFTPRKVLVIPRKQWLCPNMTEKLLTGTLSINTNKMTYKHSEESDHLDEPESLRQMKSCTGQG